MGAGANQRVSCQLDAIVRHVAILIVSYVVGSGLSVELATKMPKATVIMKTNSIINPSISTRTFITA